MVTKTKTKKKEVKNAEESLLKKMAVAQKMEKDLRKEADVWRKEKENLLEQILATNPEFEMDKYMTTQGKECFCYREGSFKLLKKQVITRVPDVQKIITTFGGVLPKIVKVSLSDADRILGKETVDKFSVMEKGHRYEVVDLRQP